MISNLSKKSARGSKRSVASFENQFKDFIHYEEDDQEEEILLLPERPQLTRKYTGYGFAQQEKILDEALRNAEN